MSDVGVKGETVHVGVGVSRILGLTINAYQGVEDAAQGILNRTPRPAGFICGVNAEMMAEAARNRSYWKVIAGADLRYPDGLGVVLAMRRTGVRSARVPGVELWEKILKYDGGSLRRVALVGGVQGVAARAAERLAREHGIEVVLVADGYADLEDVCALEREVQRALPDFIGIATGSPSQEELAIRLRRVCPDAILMNLGGSLDVYVGDAPRAPKWTRKLGLEWLARLFVQPSRLGRLLRMMPFILRIVTNRLQS